MILKAVKDRENGVKNEGDRLLIDATMDLGLPESVLVADLLTLFVGGFHTSGARKLVGLVYWLLYAKLCM